MMKSFFKKLAFVMALAMVVSLAAPAGSAMAAEALRVVTQETNEVVTEWNIAKVGETQDFKFWDYKGAENWKNIYQWSSDNEAVATVDTAGVVTAVAEGEANITITVGDYVGTVKVTVGEPKVELAYEAVQKDHDTVAFVFNQNVDYTAEDVTLTKMYGDYPINWPFTGFNCKDNTVTIDTYVEFEDGDKYIVKIGAEDEGTEFITTIGAIDEIKVTWKSTALAEEEELAYAPLDEDDTEIPVYLSYKLLANGVDVTNAKKYKDGEIAYLVDEVQTPFKDKVDIDELDGKPVLYFEDITASIAFIIPTFTYEGAENDETFIGETVYIPATPAPAYGLDSLVAWSIVKEGDDKVTWYGANETKGFRLFNDVEKDHTLVALVKDNLGKYYAFPDSALEDIAADKYKYNNKNVLLFDKHLVDGDNEIVENYRLEFKSTNDNTLFVGNEDGSITTIVDKKTSVLVSLYDENEDGEEYLVKHLTALTIDIDEQRKIDDIVITACGELPSDGAFTTGDVTFKVVDQDGNAIAAKGLTIETSVDKEGFTEKKLSATAIDDKVGEFKVTVDGSKYTYTKSSGKEDILSSVKYTVKVNDTNVKGDFTVKIAEPEYKTVDGVEVIDVEEYKADASNMNLTIDKSADLGKFKQTITVYEYSNDLKVGIKDDKITLLTKGNALLDKDSKNLEVLSSEAEEGDVFVVVYDKNGVAVDGNMIKEVEPGKYEFTAATTKSTTVASGSAIDVTDYKADGTYAVKVYTITREYETDKASKSAVEVTEFTVSRNNPKIELKKQDVVDLTDEGTIDLDTLVRKAFSFKFDSNDLTENEAYFVITENDYKYNEASGRVYIYRVHVYAPLNNGNDNTFFDAGNVTVNKYVEVDELAE